METKAEEHPIQVEPTRMGTTNAIKRESGKVLCYKGDFKSYPHAMSLGRNHTNAASITTALSRRKL